MEEMNLNPVDAGQENVVGSQIEATQNTGNEAVPSVNEEVANPQTAERPTQTQEENSRYAAIRREAEARAEQRAKDQLIAELYGQDYGIYSYADYQKAMEQQRVAQEAQQKGIDPELYQTINSLQEKVSTYERKTAMIKQDETLSNDPHVGSLYKEWKNDVYAMADQYNVDLDTAFTILTRERIGDILGKTKQQTEQEVIRGLQSNASSSPGALSTERSDIKQNYNDMPKKDFDALLNKVLNGEVR